MTKKLIDRFEFVGDKILVIDKVMKEINIPRRRIYDIINIMEILHVVEKIKKNMYRWRGLRYGMDIIRSYGERSLIENTEYD